MQSCESTLMTRMPAVAMVKIEQPTQQHLAWYVDESFTDDLLLAPNRMHIADVVLTRRAHGDRVDITVEIQNRLDHDAHDVRITATVQDDFGMTLNRTDRRLSARVDHLHAGSTETVHFSWQGSRYAEPYHLMLVIEDAKGTMLDTVAGTFKVA